MICSKCGKDHEKLYKYGVADNVCRECLLEMAEKGNLCPTCGYQVSDTDDEVCLILTPKGSTPEEKKKAPEVAVVVCPACRSLHFDELNYRLIQGLKRS